MYWFGRKDWTTGREGSVAKSSEHLFVLGSGEVKVPKSNALETGLEGGVPFVLVWRKGGGDARGETPLVLHNKVFHTTALQLKDCCDSEGGPPPSCYKKQCFLNEETALHT